MKNISKIIIAALLALTFALSAQPASAKSDGPGRIQNILVAVGDIV